MSVVMNKHYHFFCVHFRIIEAVIFGNKAMCTFEVSCFYFAAICGTVTQVSMKYLTQTERFTVYNTCEKPQV